MVEEGRRQEVEEEKELLSNNSFYPCFSCLSQQISFLTEPCRALWIMKLFFLYSESASSIGRVFPTD
jgi:hypothetical protein